LPDSDVIGALAASPEARWLTRLMFESISGGSDLDLRSLASSPHLGRLANSPYFPKLQELEIGNHVRHVMSFHGARVLQAFADSRHFPELRRIHFGSAERMGYSPEGVLALIRSPHLPRLEYVDIYFGDGWTPGPGEGDIDLDGAAFVRHLAALPEAARLRILRLDHLCLTDHDVQPLLTSPYLAGLEMLNVDGNQLSKAAIQQLRQRFPAVSADRHQRP
jgi:hypothetical protein